MTMLGRSGASWLKISDVTAGVWARITLSHLVVPEIIISWLTGNICFVFPSWMLHKTQENAHLYLLLLISLMLSHFWILVISCPDMPVLNALGVYSVAQAYCRSVFPKVWEAVWVRPWETSLWQQCPCWAERIGEPRSIYRASCVLAGAAAHHNMSVCVWETCIPLGIWASIGEMRNVIFSLGKHTAGMCLCMHVSDCTFGRAICHSAGGWSGKSIDCKLTGEVLSDTNHFYMRGHTRLQRCCL